MIDQIEELLRAGAWLGPAVLGSLSYRFLSGAAAGRGDDLAGAVLLGTSALILTIAGAMNSGRHPALGPMVFGAMFVASWSLQ